MLRKAAAWLLLIGLVALWAFNDRLFPPETLTAPSADVRDGDSFIIGRQTVRLHGIDAPEYRQMCKDARGADWPCGRAARAQLEALILPGTVRCEIIARDQYARAVARCSSAGTADLGAAMVAAGLAISPAERGTATYKHEEESAREARRGIWQGEFLTPAAWRAANGR